MISYYERKPMVDLGPPHVVRQIAFLNAIDRRVDWWSAATPLMGPGPASRALSGERVPINGSRFPLPT